MPTRAPALPAEERRAAIIVAALPLLLERGANVSTRQIAEAAGIAEGTIFSVFPDKHAVIQAVLQAAIDPAPTEEALAAIDPSLPFEAQLVEAVDVIQHRYSTIWRLVSSVGETTAPRARPSDFMALVAIFARERQALRADALTAARHLRALTLAVSSPLFFAGDPVTPQEIVTLFLDGMRLRPADSTDGGAR